MRKRCKHRDRDGWAIVTFYKADGAEAGPHESHLVQRMICDRCGVVPFGPSADDDERVRVEMRAAELAGPNYDYNRFDALATDAENWGWHAQAVHPVIDACQSDEQETGWLAREIATHGEDL